MDALKHAHSGLRWVLLLLFIGALVHAFSSWKQGKKYGAKSKLLNLITMATMHTQVLIGLILYFISPYGILSGGTMKNEVFRFFAVEHILGMILAAVLMTIGRKRAQESAKDAAKHRKIFIWYLVTLIIVLASIPWPFRIETAGWF